jgi:hypothetical protein
MTVIGPQRRKSMSALISAIGGKAEFASETNSTLVTRLRHGVIAFNEIAPSHAPQSA